VANGESHIRPKAIRSHRDLEVWQRAMRLVEQVYQTTRTFPREEMFLLTAQMRRAALSVACNIAEGHGRTGRSEYAHHLSIAHGSLIELETQTEVSQR
jgi:four helix bundle protein